jgi:tripartite-type tricarboxylate transporter receptor subunit TctC
MPDLLTTKEQGFPNIISASWFGVVVKAGTPSDRRLVLAQALNRTLQDAEVRRRLIEAGLDVAEEANPDSFDSMIREDRDRWRRVVERGKLKQ